VPLEIVIVVKVIEEATPAPDICITPPSQHLTLETSDAVQSSGLSSDILNKPSTASYIASIFSAHATDYVGLG
jgi:hypothetical protein